MFIPVHIWSWCSQMFQTSEDADPVVTKVLHFIFAAMPCTSLPAVMMNLKCVSNDTLVCVMKENEKDAFLSNYSEAFLHFIFFHCLCCKVVLSLQCSLGVCATGTILELSSSFHSLCLALYFSCCLSFVCSLSLTCFIHSLQRLEGCCQL